LLQKEALKSYKISNQAIFSLLPMPSLPPPHQCYSPEGSFVSSKNDEKREIKTRHRHSVEVEDPDFTEYWLGDDRSTGSTDSDSSLDQAALSLSSTVATFRSRVGRRNSHSSSEGGSDVLPLIQSDLPDSDDITHPPARSHSPKSTPHDMILSGTFYWLRWFAAAVFLTYMMYNFIPFCLTLQYGPSRGVMWPGGVKKYTSKPTFHYTRPVGASFAKPDVHIPRIVHVTYKSRDQLPDDWKSSLQQWEALHPDWEIRFWSDKDLAEFVHVYYPEMEDFWLSYKYMIQRVDSVRYMILHHYGGLYSDLDIYPATSLDKLLLQWEDAGKNVLLAESLNSGITNAFMASAPGSTFMKCVVDNLPNYQTTWVQVGGVWRHWTILSSAGSSFLWGMLGHCYDDGVEVMDARSFRGCSICDAWEMGRPAPSCDTVWLHHSSTNSSWHQRSTWFHTTLLFVSYAFSCKPVRMCFLCVTGFLFLVRRHWNSTPSVKV
jgi:Glycosyltransferase sugar-binding region containing DXD motif